MWSLIRTLRYLLQSSFEFRKNAAADIFKYELMKFVLM